MIPPSIMYVLGAVLMLWGVYRVFIGRRPGVKGRGSHLIFGVVYVLMGLFLILTTSGVVPPPRFGRPAPRPAREVIPLYPIPKPPASLPAAASQPTPASQPLR